MAIPDPVNAGKSILEIMWEELDEIMDRLMTDGRPEDDPAIVVLDTRGLAAEWQAYGEERGQAQGVAYCLAVLINPYAVNVDNVRSTAMERWEGRHGEGD